MAEAPDLSLISDINKVEKSYGKNLYTFFDLNETGEKCAVEILTTDLSTRIALVEQYPNIQGYFHFDIQKILQNYTTPNYSAETSNAFSFAPDETFRYSLRYGYINGVGVFVVQGTLSNKIVIGGRKEWNELDFPYQNYTPLLAGVVGCPIISEKGVGLSDMFTTKNKTFLTGVIPDWISTDASIQDVYCLTRHRNDVDFITSWLNYSRENISFPIPTGCEGIRGVRMTLVNTSGIIILDTIYNVLFDETDPVYPYDIIHFNSGNRNAGLVTNFQNITHYYLAPYTLKGTGNCSSTEDDYSPTPTYAPIRVDIVDEQCNDFDYVQLSWLNSFGVRDYYYFTKRKDNNYTISRETYVKPEGTWGEATFSLPDYSRGEQVYNTEVQEGWTITTDFLSDEDADKLKSLFVSPDVRARFSPSNTWIPVVLTNTSWNERTFRKDKFFQYQIQMKSAHKLNIQRG